MRPARDRSNREEGTALVGVVPPPTAPADGEHVRQINDVFRRLHARLISHAERLVDRERARDAVSQTFLELWMRWPRLTPEQRSDKNFFRAVRNTAADLRDADAVFVSFEDAEPELDRMVVAEASPAWGDAHVDARGKVLDAAIRALPADRREVFILIKEQGFTYQEAADQLGISINSVNTQVYRANAAIRAALARANISLPSRQSPRLPSSSGGATND